MKKITHFLSLTSESLYQLAAGLSTTVINDKLITIPEKFGEGSIFYTQITPDISASLFDVKFKTPVNFIRLSTANDLFIFHYDLSEHINLIKINNIDYEIELFDQLDLAILDNELGASFIPPINERTIAIRIIVNKNLLKDFIKVYSEKAQKNDTTSKNTPSFYHYGNIDSNSTLLIQSIKNRPITDLSFDPLLKGISLKLLGNFFNKFYNSNVEKSEVTEIENEAIFKTKEYLQNNLSGPFPSVTFLSSMAGMSESKYKTLFKNCFNTTPNAFFIREKMLLGKKLLQSGKYNTLTEVLYELNYSKLNYFSSKYYEMFKRKPSDDFIKKVHEP